MKYGSIVPLIGGETIAMENVFGKRPEVLYSYSPFYANDSQLIEHYNNEVPYYLIDKGEHSRANHKQLNVVNAVCPCAGLSSLNTSSSSDNATNDWMVESAQFVLKNLRPNIFWGENAPRLATKMGRPTVNRLRYIASQQGYTMSLYKTQSILHGLSQTRDRAFYFFWKDARVPVLNFFRREHEKIEDTIRNAFVSDDDPMNAFISNEKPTNNPYYQYVLEEVEGGISHKEFVEKIPKTVNAMAHLEISGHTYAQVSKWMAARGYDKLAKRSLMIHEKLAKGGNIMRKTTELPKDHIGAFVGHLPYMLTHPDENRYLTLRECLHIMKLPSNFILQGGAKNYNMICQNVPVTTAEDMATEIKQYLAGKLPMSNARFVIQDNKTMRNYFEDELNTLTEFL